MMRTQQNNLIRSKNVHRRSKHRLPVPDLKLSRVKAVELNRYLGQLQQVDVFELYKGLNVDQKGVNTPRYVARQFPLLSRTGAEITALVEASDGGSEQAVYPTPMAHFRAHKMVFHLQEGGLSTPPGDIYSDADGAIRLLWSLQGRNVELVFPSDEADYVYLYHSFQDEYGVEATPSSEVALDWINWVLGNKPSSRTAA